MLVLWMKFIENNIQRNETNKSKQNIIYEHLFSESVIINICRRSQSIKFLKDYYLSNVLQKILANLIYIHTLHTHK